MPKVQTTLNFGGKPPPKKKNPQTKLDSFFGKTKNQSGATSVAGDPKVSDTADEQGKENGQNKRSNASIASSDAQKASADDATVIGSTSNDNNNDKIVKKARKRLVIDDDSDSDDEEMRDHYNEKDAKPSDGEKEATAGAQTKPKNESESESPVKKKTKAKDDETHTVAVGSEGDDTAPSKEELDSSSPASDSSSPATIDKKELAKVKSKKATDDVSTENASSTSSLTYSDVCEAFEKIDEITARLQIQEIVTKLFRAQIDSGQPDNLYPLMYLCSNTVAPAYECVELGIGDAILIKAIAEAYGTNNKTVKEKYEELGDLGYVAQSFKGKQKTLGGFFTMKTAAKKPLSCQEILATFREIANMKGNQSQKQKMNKIKSMLVRVTHPAEPKYIIRALQGKLRIGLAESTVLISLAQSLTLSVPSEAAKIEATYTKADKADKIADFPEEAKQYCDDKLPQEKRIEFAVAIIKKAYSQVPSYEKLINAAVNFPLQELHKACTLTPGVPVAPMLAKPEKSVANVLARLKGKRFTCEYKYDGERAQIHMLEDGSFRVFSRSLLDTSEKYPEVPLFVKEAATEVVTSFVCDAEVVAYDKVKDRLVPFQVLSTRKKSEISAETAKVQVIVQAFDLMYLNGESLLERTLQERRDLMHKHFKSVPGKFTFAVSLDHEENGDTTILEEFLDQAVKAQCEGLMVKTLDQNAIYEPSRRSLNWLKLKKDYLEGLGDSVDLVPIGAYHGKGKRTGVYGAYLLACYDPDSEEFQSVCKIGTGFSDEDLKSLSATLNKSTIPQKSSQYNVTDQLECDVWFDSVHVWEVKAADLSKSSTHRGAVGKTGEEGRGIGLRFPRFERIREDKRPEAATSSDQILEMYYNQDSVSGGGAMDEGI